jgi:hypothetical protein
MVTINLSKIKWSFDKKTSTILISEKEVPFDTTYNVISPTTGMGNVFQFSHSTGAEFDPNTNWIYKSTDGIILSVSNDPHLVEVAARKYLNAKLNR